MDIMLLDLPGHIFQVHPPDPLIVHLQRAEDALPSLCPGITAKSHIIGTVQKYVLPRLCQHAYRARHEAVHTVLIADMLPLQVCMGACPCSVRRSLLPPPDDRIVICVRDIEIAEGRMTGPRNDRIRHRGAGRKVHVRNPHGDEVKAFLRGLRLDLPPVFTYSVNGIGIPASAVHDGNEIISALVHVFSLLVVSILSRV